MARFDRPRPSCERLGLRPGGRHCEENCLGVQHNGALPNLSGSAIGWGVNLTSNLNFTKKDVGRFEVVYGKGIENYMNDAPVDIGVKNNCSNPLTPIKGVALPVLGVVAFVDHTWSERFGTTSIGYSMLNIENSNAMTPDWLGRGRLRPW